jgi:putative endonuclease
MAPGQGERGGERPIAGREQGAPTRTLGERGEDIAAKWAVHKGWTVLDRRYRLGHRDIDLILRRGSTVAFVEVKTRRSESFGGPISAVGRAKRRSLSRAALAWIDRHGIQGVEYRFDVIGVLVQGELIRVAHVENAFLEALPR